MQTEPIRWAVYLTAATSALGTFFITWTQSNDWRLGIGAGLLAFVLPAVGGEYARSHAWSPASHQAAVEAAASATPGTDERSESLHERD